MTKLGISCGCRQKTVFESFLWNKKTNVQIVMFPGTVKKSFSVTTNLNLDKFQLVPYLFAGNNDIWLSGAEMLTS